VREIPNIIREMPSADPDSVCGHLKPVFEFLLGEGNCINAVEHGGWAYCKLDVNFKNPIHIEALKKEFTFPSFMKAYESSDYHDPLRARFVYCQLCMCGISSPAPLEDDNAPDLSILGE